MAWHQVLLRGKNNCFSFLGSLLRRKRTRETGQKNVPGLTSSLIAESTRDQEGFFSFRRKRSSHFDIEMWPLRKNCCGFLFTVSTLYQVGGWGQAIREEETVCLSDTPFDLHRWCTNQLESGEKSIEIRMRLDDACLIGKPFQSCRGGLSPRLILPKITCVNLRHGRLTGPFSKIDTHNCGGLDCMTIDEYKRAARVSYTRKWFQISFVWHRPHFSSPYTTPVGFPPLQIPQRSFFSRFAPRRRGWQMHYESKGLDICCNHHPPTPCTSRWWHATVGESTLSKYILEQYGSIARRENG